MAAEGEGEDGDVLGRGGFRALGRHFCACVWFVRRCVGVNIEGFIVAMALMAFWLIWLIQKNQLLLLWAVQLTMSIAI